MNTVRRRKMMIKTGKIIGSIGEFSLLSVLSRFSALSVDKEHNNVYIYFEYMHTDISIFNTITN